MAKKRTTVKAFSDDWMYENIASIVDDAVKIKTRDVFTSLIKGNLTRESLISSMADIAGESFARVSTIIDTGLSVVGRERIKDVAQDLGLENFTYIGGVIGTSRDFCIQRDGGTYTREEVESWADEDWEGKIDGTDSETIFSYCGGYNCRHELIPVRS